jgi:hypothetical protein
MQTSSVRLHPTLNLWRAWMGFNLTHSLGLVLFGGAFVFVGLFEPEVFAASLLFQAVAVLGSAAYLGISAGFFFSRPIMGASAGLICFLLAAGLAYA